MTDQASRQPAKGRTDPQRMSLSDHLAELRSRLIRAILGVALAMVVCLCFGREILQFIQAPVVRALADYGYQPDLKYLSPGEYFNTYVWVGLICGLMLASPWVIYQIWAFVATGLYDREKRLVRIFGPASMGLFVAGLAGMYYWILPISLRFFLSFGQGIATPWFTWSSYISMVLSFGLAFGIGFQTPLVVIFLAVSGLVPLERMRRLRKHVVLLILVLAAVLTPSVDWQSQLVLAIPMLGLFELGMLVSWLMIRKRAKTENGADED